MARYPVTFWNMQAMYFMMMDGLQHRLKQTWERWVRRCLHFVNDLKSKTMLKSYDTVDRGEKQRRLVLRHWLPGCGTMQPNKERESGKK